MSSFSDWATGWINWCIGWVRWDTAQIKEIEQRLINGENQQAATDGVIAGLKMRVSNLEAMLSQVLTKEKEIMANVADLQNEVTQETDVVKSVVALIDGLAKQLQDAIAANDPAALQAVLDGMIANRTALASAVAANTPVAPAGS